MLLVIDIGNTSMTLGILKRGKVVKTCQIATVLKQPILRARFRKAIEKWQREYPAIQGVVICSVVPKVLIIVKAVLRREFHLNPVIIGRDIVVPIKNRYRNPGQVGQDRLVCTYAAMRLYGIPSIVIDLGTAITLDIVSKKNEYLGGIIIPGIRLSAETLFQKTALLPRAEIHKPRSLIGKDTKDSILSGLFYGYGTMIQGLIALITQKIQGRPKVIVTGGYTRLMKKYMTKKGSVVDDHLILKGLYLLWEDDCSRQNPFQKKP